MVNKDPELQSLIDKSLLDHSYINGGITNIPLNTSVPEIDSSFTPFNPQLRHLNLDDESSASKLKFMPNSKVKEAMGPNSNHKVK